MDSCDAFADASSISRFDIVLSSVLIDHRKEFTTKPQAKQINIACCQEVNNLLYNILSSWNLSRNVFRVIGLYHEEEVYRHVRGSEQKTLKAKLRCSVHTLLGAQSPATRFIFSTSSVDLLMISFGSGIVHILHQSLSRLALAYSACIAALFQKCWRSGTFSGAWTSDTPVNVLSTRTVFLYRENAVCPSTL